MEVWTKKNELQFAFVEIMKERKRKNEGTYIYLDRIVESLLCPFLSDRFYISV